MTELSTAGDEIIDPATGHVRRGLGGRLYHGETAIDFYRRRWFWLAFSGVLILISLGSLATRGLNLGIDFKGGVAWEVDATHITEAQARSVLDASGLKGSEAKIVTRKAEDGVARLFIQTSAQTEDKRVAVQQALAKQAQVDAKDVSTTSVSATWGETITDKAIRALVIFMVLVALFIAWRLEWQMAVASIVAMLHDVLISVGLYSVFGFEVTPATVVAFLTILGFSLYDTIVVFDKVRDNAEKYSGTRMPYADVLNVSMNQVLMRSLNTSLAAVLPVLSLLVLGSGILGAVTLREFALALLVGLVTGSYSSLFIASPLLAMLKEREPRYRTLIGPHATGTELERLVLGGSPASRKSERSERRTAAALAGGAVAPVAGVVGGPSGEVSPDTLLTHPPRPRKKKRSGS